MTKKHFEEKNGPKSTVSKVVKGTSPSKIRGKFFKIKVYIGIAISLLVVAILASLFLFSPNAKRESTEAISSVAKKENTSQEATDASKASEIKKKKEEEIQKLKEQLASLDSKVAESEKLVDKLKEETAVPKLDIEALRNNDLSSLKGTWRTASGKEFVINDSINESSEIYAIGYRDGQKVESTYELKVPKGQERPKSDTASFGIWPKGLMAGGAVLYAIPRGIVKSAGQYTDQSNTAEDRLVAGQSPSMFTEPENFYYRVKPDTSKLEEEEKHLAQLQAEREAIKTSLESKEKKNTN
ncbi:DUF6287 domain-containing protein [Streptococcus sp.]